MSSPQHAGLTREHWQRFTLDQQILMISNEMNRASKLLGTGDGGRLAGSYERVLALTDLTIATQEGRSLRRELLRWRDLVAAAYLAEARTMSEHLASLRALLRLTPEAARQIPFVAPETSLVR